MSKGLRCQYDRDNLEKALATMKAGNMSVRTAAKHFKVPKSTLSDRMTGRVEEDATPGHKTVFPVEVEEAIVGKVKEAGRMGFGIV